MAVVGICRFSLVGRGDWKAFQDQSAEADAATRAQAEVLFTPDRIEARLRSFELLTLASLKAQTDPDFRFVVLASTLMPQTYRDRLQALCDAVPQVILRFFPEIMAHQAQKAVFRELRIAFQDTLQFRLDDDDCLCPDFIALMKQHTAERMHSGEIFVASVRDVLFCATGGEQAGVYLWPVAFMSAGAAIRHPSKSIYEFGHFGMATRFPAVVVEGRMALVTHHGGNDTQFNAALIARRRMKRLDARETEETVARLFPFLTAEARALAGLLPPAAQSEPPAEPPAEPAAPRWYADILGARHRKGFFIADDLFALQHTARSRRTLYVSFDNLSSVRDGKNRDPWGYGVAAKAEWSSLGVLCYRPNWFRIPRLFDELNRLADSGFFEGYRQVVFTGTSMGAYAACAFSSLAPGSTVIAFSPQSTLDPRIAPWDERYPAGRMADWSGPFTDAAPELGSARKAWIVFDPHDACDGRHAERLAAGNVSLLRARHSRHYTAQFLGQIGILGTFVRECVGNEMSEARFYQLYRRSREYRRYLDGFARQAMLRASPARRSRIADILRGMNKPGIAKDLDGSLAAE